MELWSQAEIETLKTDYASLGPSLLSSMLGRTKTAVEQKAHSLGVRFNSVANSRCRILSEVEKAYVACALDTEGSLSIDRYQRKTQNGWGTFSNVVALQITNNNRPFLENIRSIVGTGTIDKPRIKTNPRWKPTYKFRIGRLADLKALLSQILPFMVIRVEQANLVLQYCELRQTGKSELGPSELRLVVEMKRVNKRGIP